MSASLRLIDLARRNPTKALIAAAGSLIVGLLGWGVAFLVQRVVDQSGTGSLAWLAAAVAAAAVLQAVVKVVRRGLQVGLVHETERDLVLDYFRRIVRVDLRRLETYSDGDLYRRLRALDLIRFALEERVYGAVFDVVLVAVASLVLATYSPVLAAIAVAGASLPALFVFASRHAIVRSANRHHEEDSRLTQKEMDVLRGIRDLRLLGGEPWALAGIEGAIKEFHDGRRGHLMQLANLQALTGLLGALAGIFVLVTGAAMVQGGVLTTGRLMFVFTLSGLLLNPLEQLAASWFAFREAKVVLARYEEVLNLPAEVIQDAAPRAALRSGIRLEGVSFGYDPSRPVLDDVTLDIPVGSTLAIVGESGAGKSTLLALLAGLYPPDKGRILVDGSDLISLSLSDWRAKLGVVPQAPHLFQASIEENIALGCSDLTPERIRAAAMIARASEFVDALPNVYSTPVAKEGGCFSAGQVQRLAIARAIARDPEVLLLDEATSNLDSRTEEGLWSALGDRQPRRTTILVTHRLKSSSWADRIAVLSEGRLVEIGTFHELMARCGHYFDLWRRQIPEDEHAGSENKEPNVEVRSSVGGIPR